MVMAGLENRSLSIVFCGPHASSGFSEAQFLLMMASLAAGLWH